jgi:HAE1 family hydrophobic/amphiphilic exporter-1
VVPPFGLTVVASVLVSLFISSRSTPCFRPTGAIRPGTTTGAQARGISRVLARFNTWFDHQADRYGQVIAWALHHRRWMACSRRPAWWARWPAGAKLRRLELPAVIGRGIRGHRGAHASSSSLEYARLKVEAAATLARTLPETKATNSNVNPGGGRIYVDIGKSTARSDIVATIAADLLRQLTGRLVGAEYVVLDDLNNGAQKPVQIRFTGTDSRQLLELTITDFMERLRQVPGAVDVGLSSRTRRTS